MSMDYLMSLAVEGEQSPLSPSTAEIEVLVRRTLAGDTAAFECIVRKFERKVLMLAVRMLGDAGAAEDAGQEVFLRAFKYLHRLDATKPMEPWLMRITVNVCRDLGRMKRRIQTTFPESATCAEPVDESPGPHDGLTAEEQRQTLRRALDLLPEKERMALLLRDVEGLSTAEVADALGSSETTVRSQICRGRIRLKEAWDRIAGGKA